MKKNEQDIPNIYQFSSDEMTALLHEAGYNTVFDIIAESKEEFSKRNNMIQKSDAKHIYQSAEERVENLQMLAMAWQIHHDPVVDSISKLSAETGVTALEKALQQAFGGKAQFDKLFPERSTSGYADATSIQSLFSPGQYLVVLYKIARQLKGIDSDRHIDKRRPDLQSLILSTVNMNDEVSSLDVLLDVLQTESASIESLKDVYHPMTLPYDDDLAQVQAAAEAQGTTLLNLWDTLLDTQRNAFLYEVDDLYTIPAAVTIENLGLTTNGFRLLSNQTPTLQELANHYGVSSETAEGLANELNNVNKFSKQTGLKPNHIVTLTGQYIYPEESVANGKTGYASRFMRYGFKNNVPVYEYGAKYLTGQEATPLWVFSDQDDLNLTTDNVIGLASRAEKLIRLRNTTGLSFAQLDWLIVNASIALRGDDKEIILDNHVLTAIAEFMRLQKYYDISSDMYVTFFGQANLYAEVGHESFYKTTFSTADKLNTVPLGTTLQFPVAKQGLWESICCGALRVTADEFSRIGNYCFGEDVQEVIVTEETIAQLYRLGRIPNMLGLTYTQAEALWRLMADGSDTLLYQIGQKSIDLKILTIIRRTELLLDWMDKYQLDIPVLQAMVTKNYSGSATPELYNFLLKIYESGIIQNTEVSMSSEHKKIVPTENIYQLYAANFNIKTNLVSHILEWLEKTSNDFTLQEYWDKIENFFDLEHNDPLHALEQVGDLVKWSQRISQYILIVQWIGFSEQDLSLLVNHPEQLILQQYTVPRPTLYMLLVLTRLKEWQQRVQVSADEAMRYFAQTEERDITEKRAINLLAYNHGWDEAFTSSINTHSKEYILTMQIQLVAQTATIIPGRSTLITATINGIVLNNVQWSIEGNYASTTSIDDNGRLKVALIETADTITVIAKTKNGRSEQVNIKVAPLDLAVGSRFQADGIFWRVIHESDDDGSLLIIADDVYELDLGDHSLTTPTYEGSNLQAHAHQFFETKVEELKNYVQPVVTPANGIPFNFEVSDLTRVSSSGRKTAFSLSVSDVLQYMPNDEDRIAPQLPHMTISWDLRNIRSINGQIWKPFVFHNGDTGTTNQYSGFRLRPALYINVLNALQVQSQKSTINAEANQNLNSTIETHDNLHNQESKLKDIATTIESTRQGKASIPSLDLTIGSRFEADGILWRVLHQDRNGNYLILSEYILNTHMFNDWRGNTYEGSRLQRYLREDFYETQLRDLRPYIQPVLTPATSSSFDEVTEDVTKVSKQGVETPFILSVTDVLKYLPDSWKTISVSSSTEEAWWLRNHKGTLDALYITKNGTFSVEECGSRLGVRPALYIRIPENLAFSREPKSYPTTFDLVFNMERWVNLGNQLRIGSRTLGDLVRITKEESFAENNNLITSVAQDLMAAVKGE